MKELDLRNMVGEKTKMEVTQQKKQEYKLTYRGTIIPHENHKLYEIDIATGEIAEASYHKRDYLFDPNWKPSNKITSHAEVIIQEGKVYVSALNEANAIKKFKKGSNGSKLDYTKSYLDI